MHIYPQLKLFLQYIQVELSYECPNRECNFDCFIHFLSYTVTILPYPVSIYSVLALVPALHAGHTTVWELFATLLPYSTHLLTTCDLIG